MSITKSLAVISTAAILLATAACGESAERPSVDDLAEAIQDDSSVLGGGSYDAESATCVAEALVDSDLSDATLASIADGDKVLDASDDQAELLIEVIDGASDCYDDSGTEPSDDDRRGGERPSTDDLAETFESQSTDALPIDAAAADCMAQLLVDSDISDATLQDIADGEIDLTGYVVRMPQDDLRAWEAVTEDVVACIVG